jgi:hypothetical protein
LFIAAAFARALNGRTCEAFMKIEKNWYLLLAVAASAGLGAAVASTMRRRQGRDAHHHQHADDIKSWENEGGNLAPAHAASTRS